MPLAAIGETAKAVSPNGMCEIEIIEIQNVIIKMQSDVINELFLQLSNFMTLEELGKVKEISKINKIAELKSGI